MYDLEKLSWIIERKRNRFKIFLAFYCALLAAGVILFFIEEKTVAFIGAVLVIAAVILIVKHIGAYSPSILFSGEKRGINIKEHEYVANIKRGLSGRAVVAKHVANGGSKSGNARIRRPHVRSAYVYISENNGNVTILDGLTSLQTDVYEIGDELLRPSGSRYPIIVSRDTAKQPCPLCGRINTMDQSKCSSCGLEILKKQH